MFIDEKEAQKRLENSTRILTSIVKQPHVSGTREVPTQKGTIPQNGSPISHEPPNTPSEDDGGITDATLKNLLNVTPKRRGVTMSTSERATLGLAGILLGGPAAGKLLDRGSSTSHELRHGYRSQVDMYEKRAQDPELISKLDEQRSRVRDLAFDRLTSAVGLITHEKLAQIKDVTKLSKVSRDLVTVVDKTSPKEAAIEGGLHFHVWKPEMKTEEQYEVINVNSPRD